jgi:sugar phosphate isomerase/epimerase
MNRVALHTSSFVGKQCGYQLPHSWEDCVQALSDYYRPIATFPERFEELILHVQALGFDVLDVWQPGVLNWEWAASEHIASAQTLLEHHHMAVTSLAGEFGQTRDEFLSACQLAKGIQAPILSGLTDLLSTDRDFVVGTLKEFDLKLALENHPETTAQEMLDEIGDGGGGRIGTAVDTGWYATRGYDVVRAIRELNTSILHIHLKDVLPGGEHINCGYGRGCVPLEACVQALKELGYTGDYSIENHTLDHDPDAELKEGGELVRRWLSS